MNAIQHPTPPLSGPAVTSFTQYVTGPLKYRKGKALAVPKSRPYDPTKEDRLQNALAAVNNNGLSLRQAAKLYNVHRSTLIDRYYGKPPLQALK